MKVLSLLLAGAFFVCLLGFCGCSDGTEAPSSTGVTADKPDDKKDEPKDEERKAEQAGMGRSEREEPGEEGEQEGDGDEDDKPPVERKSEEERLWPDHPLARKILTDPNDTEKPSSYWANAKEGDWVRFLNWQKNVIIYRVTKREGNMLKMSVKQYERNGKEMAEETEDVRDINIEEDDKVMRNSAIQNPFVERYVYEWPLYNSDKILYCERRWVPNHITGDNNDTCRSWDVRCGGFVFQRRGNTTYVVIIDHGDAEHPPKWDHLDSADMFKYWHKYDRFLHQPFITQEDPERGEQPERPEDFAPAELIEKLKGIDKLVGSALKAAIMENRFDDAVTSLEQIKEPIAQAVTYAEKNNYKPAVSQAQVVNEKADELIGICKEQDSRKALDALAVLRDEIDWLSASVGGPTKEQ